jgi:dienelactone hydrolase
MKSGSRAMMPLMPLMIVTLVAIACVVLAPYWHSAAMLVRTAATQTAIGRVARWDARPVTARVETIATPEGPVRVRIFTPDATSGAAVLLVSGVHPDGIDEARLVALASDLASTGVNVVTPEIPDLRQYRLTARVTDTLEHAAEWLADRRELSGGQRIGMIGVSFTGGLAVVAAGRPRLRDRVAYVLSFGGHGNLPRVLRFFCTGIEPQLPGSDPKRRMPHDYALAVLLHQAADLAVPPDQAEPLRRGIEIFLHASAMARIDQPAAQGILEAGRAFQEALPEPSATLIRLVNNRDVTALGARLLPYLDRLGQDPSLSPDRSPPPTAAVYLLHGADDNVIPAVESQLLAAHLAGRTRVRVLLSGFLRHVDVTSRPTLADTWRMIAFWKSALGER